MHSLRAGIKTGLSACKATAEGIAQHRAIMISLQKNAVQTAYSTVRST